MSQYDPTNPPPVQPGELGDPSWDVQDPPGPSPSVQSTMNQMTERLQTVIDAAERAAEAIRYDAEEQARRHLAEAQRKADRMTAERVRLISEMTDDLVRHAGQVRDHSEQMVRSLEEAISSVTGKLDESGLTEPFSIDDAPRSPYEGPPPPPDEDSAGYGEQAPHDQPDFAPPPEPTAFEEPAFEQEPAFNGEPALEQEPPLPPVSEEALLHATRLAVAGNDREAIGAALRDQFGVTDPDPIIDRVLGT